MLCTNIVLNVKTKTKKQFLYTTCSEHVFLITRSIQAENGIINQSVKNCYTLLEMSYIAYIGWISMAILIIQVAILESCLYWKLTILNIAKIEYCQNWILPKLKISKVDKTENC